MSLAKIDSARLRNAVKCGAAIAMVTLVTCLPFMGFTVAFSLIASGVKNQLQWWLWLGFLEAAANGAAGSYLAGRYTTKRLGWW
jgi:Ni/Fe-hydrogenase subunit HybB-like protein